VKAPFTLARAARTVEHGAHGGQQRLGLRRRQRRGRQPERARRSAQRAQQQAAVQAAQRPAAGRAAQPGGQRGQAGQRAGLRRAPRVLLVLPPLGLACACEGMVRM
jgi:hypothetical protein